MKWLSDATLAHLRKVADWPELDGNRYELVEKIGQGGMGAVFLVHDRELDRRVALKVLHVGSDDTDVTARMMKEACILARLEHPSIVPVHDCGVLPDGRVYYTMKLVRGQRLDQCISPTTALVERLQLFLKICDAIAFAHAQGVLHRDLKPQNIMLGAFGEVLVLDWGVAQVRGDGPSNSGPGAGPPIIATQMKQGTVVGTPGYMSPEQARGEVGLIDERADVYALGAILHFLLTGRAPSPATAPVPPRKFDRSIPRPLEAICMKALAGERDERQASVAELSGDVADFLAGRRVRAYPEGPLETALRLATKYRAALALILTYLVVRILLFFLNP